MGIFDIGRALNLDPRAQSQRLLLGCSQMRGARAICEAVENRVLLTTVIVNTPIDALYPPNTGLISLRSAVATANTSSSATAITFEPAVFSTLKTIVLNGTRLELSNTAHSISIMAPAAGLTISGNDNSNVLSVDRNVTATLSGVLITSGNRSGIYNDGTLTLTNASVSGNSSSSGGGGIFNDSDGRFVLTNCVVANNTSGGGSFQGGGGIDNNSGGRITLTDVAISGNRVNGFGGGIYSLGTISLTDVSVTGNTASSGDGGGIQNQGPGVMTNVTIADNVTVGSGGGVRSDNMLTLTNVTVAGNSADGNGGGIDNSGSLTIVNTIISGNTCAGSGPDASGIFSSLGYNLVGKTDGSIGWNAADFAGTIAHPLSARLGTLSNSGGLTQTLLPLAGSRAIDNGFNALIPKGITTDQRGLPRIANGTVDIGAVEVQLPTATITGSVILDSNADGKLDAGETGLSAIKVYIDANKNGAADSGETSVATDASGNFKFPALAVGTYRIREVLPTGDALTAPAVGYFDVTLKAGQAASGYLFADAPATAMISGRVFNDGNGNGVRDPGEAGMGLWTVFIDTNNDGKIDGTEVSVTTDFFGNWSFKGLTAGTYTVRVVPVAGLAATKPNGGMMTLKLSAGQVSSGNLFGEKTIV